jgi:hypothetical protein
MKARYEGSWSKEREGAGVREGDAMTGMGQGGTWGDMGDVGSEMLGGRLRHSSGADGSGVVNVCLVCVLGGDSVGALDGGSVGVLDGGSVGVLDGGSVGVLDGGSVGAPGSSSIVFLGGGPSGVAADGGLAFARVCLPGVLGDGTSGVAGAGSSDEIS